MITMKMKRLLIKSHILAGLFGLFTPMIPATSLGATLGITYHIGDTFESGAVNKTTNRIRTSQIDSGLWYGVLPYGGNGNTGTDWEITGGVIQNDSTTPGTGYPSNAEAESPIWKFFSNTATAGEEYMTLSFDYSVATGDKLFVHLWGYTGTAEANNIVSNPEAAFNGSANNGEGGTVMDAFNLLDGATSGFGGAGTALSGELTGSGTFSTGRIKIADLGIAGVTDVSGFSNFLINIAKDEDGLAGTTTIDNFRIISVVPEPSSTALLGLGLGSLLLRRKRR
jgi:uncharacterized membrane protein